MGKNWLFGGIVLTTLLSRPSAPRADEPLAGAAGRGDEAMHGEIGLRGDLDPGDAANRAIGPQARLYFGAVPIDGVPADQAAFLGHVGFAQGAVSLEQGAGQDASGSGSATGGDGLGFDATLRWVVQPVPLTVTLTYTGQSYRWLTDGETDVKLRYNSYSLQAGYYVLPNTELSLAFGYTQPDLWVRQGDSWRYIAWDVFSTMAEARTVIALGHGSFVAAHAAVPYFKDQQSNSLYGIELDGLWYPTPDIGFGPRVSLSSFSNSSKDEWSNFLRVLGARELSLVGSFDLGWRWHVGAALSYVTPESDGEDVDSEVRLALDAAWRW